MSYLEMSQMRAMAAPDTELRARVIECADEVLYEAGRKETAQWFVAVHLGVLCRLWVAEMDDTRTTVTDAMLRRSVKIVVAELVRREGEDRAEKEREVRDIEERSHRSMRETHRLQRLDRILERRAERAAVLAADEYRGDPGAAQAAQDEAVVSVYEKAIDEDLGEPE